MTPADWLMITGAAFASLICIALLYAAWKRPGRPIMLLVGWGALLAALVIAFFGNGDRGVSQIVVIAMIGATTVFALPLLKGIAPPVSLQRGRRQSGDGRTPSMNSIKTGLGAFWTFIVSGPLAGFIALFAAAGIFKIVRPDEGSPATAGVIAIISAVVLWALFSVLLLIEPRPGRRSAYAGAALAATAAWAFI